MKIALVCDDLVQFGGAERVVKAVSEIWPDAPIYTSVASKEWLGIFQERKVKVITSFLQKLPFAPKLNRYYSPFLIHILAFQSFDFSKFDVVLSLSSRYAHFIKTKSSTKHICYMNTPGRMFWEPFDYFQTESFGYLSGLKRAGRILLQFPLSMIRVLDYVSAQQVDNFIVNSQTAKRRIDKHFHRESEIIHPFFDLKTTKHYIESPGKHFLVITRLVSWKKVEIAIQACEELGEKLVVIGEGPDLNRLKSYAGKNTEFLGYVSEQEKEKLISECKALIVTQWEDFGIAPLEAMSEGKMVIAYGRGGVLETVIPGVTGEFFYGQNKNLLVEQIKIFDSMRYNPQVCKTRAEEFSKQKFQDKIRFYVSQLDKVY